LLIGHHENLRTAGPKRLPFSTTFSMPALGRIAARGDTGRAPIMAQGRTAPGRLRI